MTVYNVANQTELNTAKAAAVGGDVINIAAGTYDNLDLPNNFTSTVLFQAADPQNQPTIGRSGITGTNIHIKDVKFKYTWTLGDADLETLIGIEGADTVQFQNVVFEGDVIGPSGPANKIGGSNGLAIRSNTASNNIWFRDCVFDTFFKCTKANHSARHRYTRCELKNIRSDGATYDHISGTEAYDYPGLDTQSSANFGLVVEYCYMHNWQRAADGSHADAWQIQRSTGQGSHWAYFLYNVVDHADDNYGQAFFGGNSGQSKNATTEHSNFFFIGNLMYISHTHAINHLWVNGVTCQFNTLILIHLDAGDGPGVPTITFDGSTSALIDSNIACAIANAHGGEYTVTNNFETVNDANYDSYFNYDAAAYSGIKNPPDTYNDYEIKAGSALDVVGLGSPLQKKESGWGGNGVEPHPDYPGGFRSAVTLPTLPSGSVSAIVTVP